MDQTPNALLIARFDSLSAQMQKAARWILDHPEDAALLSMREQARRAGVQAATMTRLARSLDLDGFDALRDAYARQLRDGRRGLADHAEGKLQTPPDGPAALAAGMLSARAGQIAALGQGESLTRIAEAAEALAGARRIYCLGLRSSHAVAWHLHYVLSLISDRTVLLDGIGGPGTDPLHRAGAGDVLFATGVQPYTRAVVEAADFARARGLHVVALTDSPVSPLLRPGDTGVIVPTASAGFFHAMAPAFALTEVLAALIARGRGDDALSALRGLDHHLAALNTYLIPDTKA